MRTKSAREFCLECFDQIFHSSTDAYVENPSIPFIQKAKNGDFDALSEDEYNVLLAEVETISKLFHNRPRRTAGSLLLDILNSAPTANYALKDGLANLFACLLADPAGYKLPPLSKSTLEAIENFQCDPTPEMMDDLDYRFEHIYKKAAADVAKTPSPTNSPRGIRDSIAQQVIGQPEAVKAAALITYNHLAGRRSNSVFAGPSGCGKSEIWRSLSFQYPDLVRMVDFSRFSAEGWNGSQHLRDIFDSVNAKSIEHRGLIVVLDEADKILCEHAIGGGGTDHNVLLQNDLLKMMDGDVIEFGEETRKEALRVDCSKVSVVMLGAFERLLEGKARRAKHIGFSPAAKTDARPAVQCHKDISYDDLIGAGMRREIAGRVNKIVALEQLSVEDYRTILMGPVLSGLRDSFKCTISIDSTAADGLAERAISSGLGVRWMRSEIVNAIDDALFDDPDAEEYAVTMQDGRLRGRAQVERKVPSVRKPRRSRAPKTQELPF